MSDGEWTNDEAQQRGDAKAVARAARHAREQEEAATRSAARLAAIRLDEREQQERQQAAAAAASAAAGAGLGAGAGAGGGALGGAHDEQAARFIAAELEELREAVPQEQLRACTVDWVQVEPGRPAVGDQPSLGPAYRHMWAADGPPAAPHGATTCRELWSGSVRRYGGCRCLGWRPPNPEGKPGPYSYMTYDEAEEQVVRLSAGLAAAGLRSGDRVAVLAPNSPEWMLVLQVRRLAEPPPAPVSLDFARAGAGTGGGASAPARPRGAIQTAHSAAKAAALASAATETSAARAAAAAAAAAAHVCRPSLLAAVQHLQERCVAVLGGGRCAGCGRRLLPPDPSRLGAVPTDLRLLRLAGCGHYLHHRCIEAYLASPPFGKGCPVPGCGERVSHPRLVTDPAVLEARWAARHARRREEEDAAAIMGF
ncbi:Long chain acyl-CoA synthetase 1 [Tetrabaena socialis]|uniref:Long chain acyl-CoA synthetase 1 n=1 Tax=Tetrabaena socialis TaxID=47790 RepID=A0A2J8A1W6_9CHLO|nr:Long chain acyl-CoA synthetase 1 [Tetrabaena socialis]|eukprot:PNH06502.1 Long chain acyl-CoA synthetase 1 [Tetrabaena socialis]